MPDGAIRPRIDCDLLRIKDILHEGNQSRRAVYVEIRNDTLIAVRLVRRIARQLGPPTFLPVRPCGAASLPAKRPPDAPRRSTCVPRDLQWCRYGHHKTGQ